MLQYVLLLFLNVKHSVSNYRYCIIIGLVLYFSNFWQYLTVPRTPNTVSWCRYWVWWELCSFGGHDSRGASAVPVSLSVQLCNCSGIDHGQCVWNQLQDTYSSNDSFQIVECTCRLPLYDGTTAGLLFWLMTISYVKRDYTTHLRSQPL